MLVQMVAYGICAVCAIGAAAGFVAVAWQGVKRTHPARFVQRTNVAQCVLNAPLAAHNAR